MSVYAVVVTYNRLSLLKRAVAALREQTKKFDRIVIVNNGSTDGTSEWLNEQMDLLILEQENLGGSGGFYAGIALSMAEGAEWIFVADDDGVADKHALEYLSEHVSEKYSSLCCAVVSNEDEKKLAFSLPKFSRDMSIKIFSGSRSIRSYDELISLNNEQGLYPLGNFFNGCLISADAIKAVGNVNRDMFISGDEVDMMWRLNSYKPVMTVCKAKHYHPPSVTRVVPDWRKYYVIRNGIYNIMRHYSLRPIRIASLLTRYWRMLLVENSRKYFLLAVSHGFKGKLGRLK